MLAGGTDLAGQIDRGITTPSLLVDLQDAGLGGIERDGDGLRIGATTTLADLASTRSSPRSRRSRQRQASPPRRCLRNQGTVGGNLCQHTRCWYYRGEEWTCWLGGGDTCFAQIGDHRKHNLEAGDCISAHPSDLAPALAVCGATVVVRSPSGEREIPLLDLYRRPTDDNRSLVTLARGELVVAVRLPAPPDASVYLRAGERQAFSFPLVSVAAARHGAPLTLAAAGVANIPRALDPADPLAGPPGPSAERLEAEGARDARRAGARPSADATGVAAALWLSYSLAPARRRDREDVCDVDEHPGRAGDAFRLVSILDLADSLPDLGGDRQRPADQVGIGNAVDVRLVGGVERETEPSGRVGLAHPEARNRHRDVLMDARERERQRRTHRGPLGAVSAGQRLAVADRDRRATEHAADLGLVEARAAERRGARGGAEFGPRPYG